MTVDELKNNLDKYRGDCKVEIVLGKNKFEVEEASDLNSYNVSLVAAKPKLVKKTWHVEFEVTETAFVEGQLAKKKEIASSFIADDYDPDWISIKKVKVTETI
jgi:hypothetical protein